MKIYQRSFLVWGFITILLVSHSQMTLSWLPIQPLQGAFKKSKTAFSFNEFLVFSFQDSLEQETARHLGLQPFWVRFYNQIRFGIFGLINENNSVGENGIFFGKTETKVATSFSVGESAIAKAVLKLQKIHLFLQQHEISSMVVLAPNKSRYLQNQLQLTSDPVHYLETPYESARYHLKKAQIPFWDAGEFFGTHQKGHPFLMPPLGIHWSVYGAAKSISQILKVLPQWGIPSLGALVLGECEFSTTTQSTDSDMLEAVNLLVPPKSKPLCYPQMHWKPLDTKPKIISIGDSMYLTLMSMGLHRELFHPESLFLFYNRSALQEWVPHRVSMEAVSLTDELLSADMVFFVVTEVNFHQMDFGVPTQLFHELEIRASRDF